MIDAISAFFSGLAILVAIYAANTANKSADATIRSANCSMIFDEYLIKRFPNPERALILMAMAICVMETNFVMF